MLSQLKQELICYGKDYKAAAAFYRVSERTIRRWAQNLDIYEPRKGYQPNKLNMIIARRIRNLYNEDQYTQTELAKKFGVCQGTIAKIVNNVIYRTDFTISGKAEVKVHVNE